MSTERAQQSPESGDMPDRTPHTHGGTDAPECTPYGVRCRPDLQVEDGVFSDPEIHRLLTTPPGAQS